MTVLSDIEGVQSLAIINLPLSWYDCNTVEKDVKLQVIHLFILINTLLY